VINVACLAWETAFVRQTRNRFRKESTLAADCDALFCGGLPSWVAELSLVDVETATLTTTDAKCLSRYHWEDLLHVQVGNSILL
jgi:hypothetical protein